MRHCLALFLLIFMSLSIFCYSQTSETNPSATPLPTPVPYEDDEFPQWMKDLRRAEVLIIGSLPFTFFYAIEMYDLYRWFSNDRERTYAPWPVKGPDSVPYEENEKIGIIITAVSLSVSIAIADYIIVKIRKGRYPVSKSK